MQGIRVMNWLLLCDHLLGRVSVDGQDGEPMDVPTVPPQGSASQWSLSQYTSPIFTAVEDHVEDIRAVSIVNETWVVEGTAIDDVISKLEQFGANRRSRQSGNGAVHSRIACLTQDSRQFCLQQSRTNTNL